MKDLIIIAIILLLAGAAACYLYRAKKKGQKCIGCPYGSSCCQKHSGSCAANNQIPNPPSQSRLPFGRRGTFL